MTTKSVSMEEFTCKYALPTLVSGAAAYFLTKYGSRLITFGAFASHACIFAMAQSALAHLVADNLKMVDNPLTNYLISHIMTGSALFALSHLALKVGLVASVLSLTGAITLILATAAISIGTMTVSGLLYACITSPSQSSPT